MRIIFMGSPGFALPALEALVKSDHEVIAVYSQPPRPAGRGHKLTPSPVHRLADQHGIPVYTPESLKDEKAQQQFAALKADVGVVVAYGLLLPKAILDAPKYGCLNIHPSLLPRWRGAAPIQRSIMAGDKETAVCIMQMDAGLDTGDILMQENLPLPEDITAGKLSDILAHKGAELTLQTLDQLPTLTPVKQAEAGATYAKKITKEEGRINWYHSAESIVNQVRGLNPFPLATMLHGDTILKVHLATQIDFPHDKPSGTVLDDRLTIACGKGEAVRIVAVQKPGGNPMLTPDFLRGYKIEAGEKLVVGS